MKKNYDMKTVIATYNAGPTTGQWLPSLLAYGYFKELGWIYDFRDELKKYVVKTKDGTVREVWGPKTKTSVRKALGNNVVYILEVPDKYK